MMAMMAMVTIKAMALHHLLLPLPTPIATPSAARHPQEIPMVLHQVMARRDEAQISTMVAASQDLPQPMVNEDMVHQALADLSMARLQVVEDVLLHSASLTRIHPVSLLRALCPSFLRHNRDV